MSIRYKIDILEALKEAGYSSVRIRREKLMGQATLSQLRYGELVSWKNVDTICRLLDCQPGDLLEYEPHNDEQEGEQHMTERQIRQELNRLGYSLRKSRRRTEPSPEEYERFASGNSSVDMGGYRITDNTGAIIEGRNYEFSLEDVEGWVKTFIV